jgi:plasmid stabilization system protein ParE
LRATRELETIRAYISEVNPHAAQRLTLRLLEAADRLSEFPDRFRASGSARELVVVRPYVIRYRVRADHVLILRVRHGAQRISAR